MDTVDNLTLKGIESKCLTRSQAIEAGKADPDSITLRSFTLIKSRRSQLYGYAPGTAGIFLHDDVPQSTYRLDDGKWTSDNTVYFDWQRRAK
jgi:hypothetical protein